MSYIRVVMPVPEGTENMPGSSPGESFTWQDKWKGQRMIDYSIVGGVSDIPANSVYAAFNDGAAYKTIVQAPAGLVFPRHLAGWDPATWPYPN